jgi:hypothetical protein
LLPVACRRSIETANSRRTGRPADRAGLSADFVCLLVVAGIVVAGFATGSSVCLWRALFGVPCPGCGMTRALLSLACGDLRAAWRFNPASFVVAPILVGTVIQRVWPRTRGGNRAPSTFVVDDL